MLDKIKKNKWNLILLFLVFLILCYCHLNTFIINDDLPYSLFLRENVRITNIQQIITNQIFDYFHINARVFLHGIVQFLLIFDKKLWSILNPLVIVIIIFLVSYILYIVTKKQTKLIYIMIMFLTIFLLLYNYKNLIYWVAGSVNYVWVFLLLILVFLYYIKYGLLSHPFITFFICLFSSMICEVMGIFIFTIIIGDFILKLFEKQINKKNIFKYLAFILGTTVGIVFIFCAPSTIERMHSADSTWMQLPVVDKLLITLPIISKNIFNPLNLDNLLPMVMIVSILYYFIANKQKISFIYIIFIVIIILAIFLFQNNWCYFILGIILFIFQLIILIKNKDYKLLILLTASYLILYSLSITQEYSASRTGFHTLLIMGMFAIYNFTYNRNPSKIFKIIFICILMILLLMEIFIYTYIGTIKKEREKSLELVQTGKTNTLDIKLMNPNFFKFHIDADSPTSKDYWAYEAFEDYYKLPKDIQIKTKY